MLDRWYENAYKDDNLFLTMARRPGLLDATWGFIRYIYGGGSSVDKLGFSNVPVAFTQGPNPATASTSQPARRSLG